jgi:tRNA A-37 threonylcarbamoyl transferase component Bud32/tetratricopeptide (TPR) repeat protein
VNRLRGSLGLLSFQIDGSPSRVTVESTTRQRGRWFERTPSGRANSGLVPRSGGPPVARLRRRNGDTLASMAERGTSEPGVDDEPATAVLSAPGDGIRTRPDSTPPPPRWNSRYTLVRKLGEGGMGEVYVAYDEQLDRRVAMKLLRRVGTGADEESRILREAQALARLSHPNVVQIHDVGQFEDRIFLAMELVVGANLRQWLRVAPRRWQDVLSRMLEAGEGLAAAHRAGLIHRDIKPDNILVGDDGRVRVADFGLARTDTSAAAEAADATLTDVSHGSLLDTPLTEAGAVVGTPAYMAPEQYLGAPLDVRSDVYSFCVVLYEALYGRRPFRGRDFRELAAAALKGEFTPPPREPPLPGWLVRVITRGLAPDPNVRPAGIEALLADLRRPLTAARRRWQVFGVVAALGVGVGLGQFAMSRPDLCEGVDGAAAATWTAPRKQQLHDALSAAGEVGAEIWARIEAPLDGYAEALTAATMERCRDYHRGELSDRLYDLGQECLARRGAELGALVNVLTSADREVLSHAVDAVAHLRPIADCSDARTLLSPVAPPDAAATARARDLARRIDRVRTQRLAGLYTAADAAAAVLVDEARDLGYAPVLAEALIERGRLATELARFKPAAWVDLPEATALAEAAGADDVRLEALTAWLRALGHAKDLPGELIDVVERQALALVERSDVRGRRVHGAVLVAAGEAYLERDQYDLAGERLDHASGVLEALGDGAASDLAEAYNDLAMLHMVEKRYPESHAAFGRARALIERTSGPHHPNLGFLANNEGRAFDKQGDRDAARALFAQAYALWEPYYGPDHPNTIQALTHLARVEVDLKEDASARVHAERSLESRTRISGADDPSLVHPLLLLVRLDLRAGDHARARERVERARAIQERSVGADSPKMLEVLNLTVQVALAEERPRDALEPAERALAVARTDLLKAKARLALARIRGSLGDLAAARDDAEAAATAPELRAEAEAWLAEHPAPAARRRR